MTINTEEIAALNDLLRTGANPALGRLAHHARHSEPDPVAQFAVMQKVRSFADFSDDNNPHGERDFGAIDLTRRVFWKIGITTGRLTAAAKIPADPFMTRRVLTLMLAHEY